MLKWQNKSEWHHHKHLGMPSGIVIGWYSRSGEWLWSWRKGWSPGTTHDTHFSLLLVSPPFFWACTVAPTCLLEHLNFELSQHWAKKSCPICRCLGKGKNLSSRTYLTLLFWAQLSTTHWALRGDSLLASQCCYLLWPETLLGGRSLGWQGASRTWLSILLIVIPHHSSNCQGLKSFSSSRSINLPLAYWANLTSLTEVFLITQWELQNGGSADSL